MGVVLMAVDAANLNCLAVDEQLSVLNSNIPETYLLSDAFDGFSVGFL